MNIKDSFKHCALLKMRQIRFLNRVNETRGRNLDNVTYVTNAT